MKNEKDFEDFPEENKNEEISMEQLEDLLNGNDSFREEKVLKAGEVEQGCSELLELDAGSSNDKKLNAEEMVIEIKDEWTMGRA